MRPLAIVMLIVASAFILFVPIAYLTSPSFGLTLQNYLLSGFIFVEILLFLIQRLENERGKPTLEVKLDSPQQVSEEMIPKGDIGGRRQTITVSSKGASIRSLVAELSVNGEWVDKLRWERMAASTNPPMVVLRPGGRASELVRGDLPQRTVVTDIDLLRGETENVVVWEVWKHSDGSHVLILNTELKRMLDERDWKGSELRVGVRFLSEGPLQGKINRRYSLSLTDWERIEMKELA